MNPDLARLEGSSSSDFGYETGSALGAGGGQRSEDLPSSRAFLGFVTAGDLARDHRRAQLAFGQVVGGMNAIVIQKGEEMIALFIEPFANGFFARFAAGRFQQLKGFGFSDGFMMMGVAFVLERSGVAGAVKRFGPAGPLVQAPSRSNARTAIARLGVSDRDSRDAIASGLRRCNSCAEPLFEVAAERVEVDVFKGHLQRMIAIVPGAATSLYLVQFFLNFLKDIIFLKDIDFRQPLSL